MRDAVPATECVAAFIDQTRDRPVPMTPMERMALALALGRRRRELEALRAVGAGPQ